MNSRSVIFIGVVAVGLGGLALSLSVFSRDPSWVTRTWHEGQPAGELPNPPNLSRERREYPLMGQTLSLQSQTVAEVPVEGSFLKVVHREGRPVWAKAKFIEPELLPSAERVRRDLQNIDHVRKSFASLQNDLGCHSTSSPKPLLRWRHGAFRVVFVQPCENPRGELFEVALSARGRVLSREAAGSWFLTETARITLFPKGPKLSHLQKTDVTIAAEPSFLNAPQVEVMSDAGVQIRSRNELESVRPEDPAFDMVQAYFFSSGALIWAEQHLKLKIEKLKVRTHVGHPEKGNVAFYYGREIRLGEGDDVTFSKIPWDPSIVVHEAMHGVIESLTGMPFKGEPGTMQEAFADALTALFLNNPDMGSAAYKNAPYQRSLRNDKKLSDRTGKMYADSLIVSGTVWEIKEQLGDETAMDLMAFLLMRGNPGTGFNEVKQDLQSWLSTCALGERCDRIGSILSRRGWL